MGTIWNSNHVENKNSSTNGKLAAPRNEVARIGKDAGVRFTRAQKIGAVACFALIGVLLAVTARSKEDDTAAQSGVIRSTLPAPPVVATRPAELPGTGTLAQRQSAAPAKMAHKRLAANVTYKDANSGVSFVYPRKFALSSADNNHSGEAGIRDLPMNFVEAGGTEVATVAVPGKMYAGTDFSAGIFRVNVNRSVSADQCSHFAFVDTSDADGEPIDAESVRIGSSDMKMTSEFAGDATRQVEAHYYHTYENGACYEYVLGLSTAGFGQKDVQAVDRDEVFGKLEKILDTVKVSAIEQNQVAQKQDAQKPAIQKSEPEKQSTEQAVAVPDSEK
jgi:hypothetical protein